MYLSRQKYLWLAVLSGAVLLFSGSACVLGELDVDEPDVFTCQSDDDCNSGFTCGGNGTCIQPQPCLPCVDNDQDGAVNCVACDNGEMCDPQGNECDCNDNDDTAFPGGTEVCDGVDNDCMNGIDDGLETMPCPKQDGVCAGAEAGCVGGVEVMCEDGCPGPDCPYGADYVPDETDANCDGFDNDCDMVVDEGCCVPDERCAGPTGGLDPDAICGALSDAECACIGSFVCNMDGSAECQLEDGSLAKSPTFQAVDPICDNGIDDDCDGVIDQGCP